jgi:hypothetical protein
VDFCDYCRIGWPVGKMADSCFLFCVFVLIVIFLNVHTTHGYYYDKGNRRILFDSFMLSIFFNCICIKGPVQTLTKCPGYYCGRHQIPGFLFSNIFICVETLKLELYFYLAENGTSIWSSCGSCPRGSRVNSTWACSDCNSSPTVYDWMYLCFMVVVGMKT